MKRLVFAAAALAILAGPAFAADGPQAHEPTHEPVRAAAVGLTDLDLSQPADQAALLSRLQRATNSVCDVQPGVRPSPRTRRAMETCRAEAMEDALARLDQPMVTRLYADAQR
jgi:UrcA family protein